MIGVGGRGRGLLGVYSSLPDVNVTHLCDADQASLERADQVVVNSGKPKPKTTNDMRRLFDDAEVDAVVVATPDHWHAPATILACDAGKDVYVEKPASHNIREGRLMVDAARRNKRIVQVGTQSRSRPSTLKAIEIIKSGNIGDVVMAKAWDVQLRDDIGHKENSAVPEGVDYDTWLGPRLRGFPSTRTAFTTSGTGTGTSGRAMPATTARTSWTSRGGLSASTTPRQPKEWAASFSSTMTSRRPTR